MGKSSSSVRKKRSKYSSQGRAKKKKDTRRRKSKRLRRHDTSCSDDDSRSSLSVSSFDSDDSFRSRRSRSRTKKDVKGTKKRARSSSSEVRKRKASKRNGERKKMHEKKTKKRRKKGRRDSSVRSSSSESWSCSSCQNRSSKSDESEYERFKAKPERRDDGKRKSENIGGGAKGRRYRSGSCSSWSRHDDSSDFLMSNIMTGENTSRRLRSIIILPGDNSEVRELDKDKHKEEITYDHDDYPYSRSNDSNDGLNNMEERSIENEKREEAAASNSKAIELTESNKFGEGQHTRNKPGYDVDRAGADDTKKENNDVSGVIVNAVNGDDLETVLRQKALENLKSFRIGLGGFQTNAKSAAKLKTPKVVGSRMAREDSAHSSLNKKIPDGGICGSESCSAKNNVHPPDQVAIPAREKGSAYASSSKNKPGLITSASRKALSNVTSTLKETPTSLKETPTSQETNQPKLASGTCLGRSATLKETPASREANQAKMSIGISLGKSVTMKETPLSLEAIQGKLASGSEASGNDDKANNSSVSDPAEPSSCLRSAAGDITLNESQDGGKEGAQLEQKTMSVMRGGELVQVKYKVYIPKKTPALARRQLKR
ncbi:TRANSCRIPTIONAL REGULATOR ATRX-LIKE PROTEIN [Salix purpurea]|uniref:TRANSCRIPTIONAL REGULATOR ATRX-LIKE PROTEIN n=1 Tax=Salix purpurea TaxID=77065 RepID=A0A9Q1AGA3_SALPP|nr:TRANSCRIPTIONAL REGULATOR ATRX-LIKE PROTEIN [Salix purpurea]